MCVCVYVCMIRLQKKQNSFQTFHTFSHSGSISSCMQAMQLKQSLTKLRKAVDSLTNHHFLSPLESFSGFLLEGL